MTPMSGHPAAYELRRQRMVERLMRQGIRHEAVLAAMNQVPRHLFVEEALRSRAYDDTSLPLGLGQTISQPYTVGRMTELLLGTSDTLPSKVLEIGTGCGYQTAVLLALGLNVYSIERIRALNELAKQNLRQVKLNRARLVCSDGYLGLPGAAPFDAILVAAAPQSIPHDLLMQLAIGGRMVLPLEEEGKQYLWLIEKEARGYRETCIEEANFVPLVAGKLS